MRNLNKKEKKLIKKYPNLFNNPLFLSDKTFDYRIVNGTPVWAVTTTPINQPDNVTITSNEQNIWSVIDYISATGVNTLLENYYLKTQVDALLNDKQDRLTAGTNIDISQVGDELVISATTTPVTAVGFADLVGNPSDNEALANELNAKASASGLLSETTARENADNDIRQWAQDTFCLESFAVELDGRLEDVEETLTTHIGDQTIHTTQAEKDKWNGYETQIELKQNITDNNLQTTSKTIVGAINEIFNKLYPIGSIYTTTNASFNPNTTFGGTWTQIENAKIFTGGSAPVGVFDTGDVFRDKYLVIPNNPLGPDPLEFDEFYGDDTNNVSMQHFIGSDASHSFVKNGEIGIGEDVKLPIIANLDANSTETIYMWKRTS